jgi:hypothetical protein
MENHGNLLDPGGRLRHPDPDLLGHLPEGGCQRFHPVGMVCVYGFAVFPDYNRESAFFIPADARGPKRRREKWPKDCYGKIGNHCEADTRQPAGTAGAAGLFLPDF